MFRLILMEKSIKYKKVVSLQKSTKVCNGVTTDYKMLLVYGIYGVAVMANQNCCNNNSVRKDGRGSLILHIIKIRYEIVLHYSFHLKILFFLVKYYNNRPT